MQFAELFNGEKSGLSVPSLAGVPAYVPQDFRGKDRQTIQRFISHVAGYAEVMGGPDGNSRKPGLVDRVQAIITSVGVAGAGAVARETRGIFLTERVEIGDISEKEIEKDVIGDLGGIIIPRHEPPSPKIMALNSSWTGAREQHFKSCARVPNQPGVIVVALGARRLDVVVRCIDNGLVNELVLDQELEEALHAHTCPKPVETKL